MEANNSNKKKLVIKRETISILRTQTGLKTGGTCDNACGKTSDICPDVVTHCMRM